MLGLAQFKQPRTRNFVAAFIDPLIAQVSAHAWLAYLTLFPGALLGDGTAFWIGHRTKREILNSWPMSKYPRVVAQSEAFFRRWGALAVFFARFVPPIRAFVPITAGALGMPPVRFYAVNIPAILLW